jgi:predicted ABC-type transport system involved in lysophospholipase L1 biosynthesis ATPase subunit
VSPLIQIATRLVIAAANSEVALEPLTVGAGQWLLLRPTQEELGPDPALAIASVLAALESPRSGSVELFGQAVEGLGYEGLARIRKDLALVPSTGGLLSSRTLRENVALPISVHRMLPHAVEEAEVTTILQRFELLDVADLYPHQVSGGTRLRTCVARSSSLSPALYIVEGTGEFVSESHVGLSWLRLLEANQLYGASVVVCITRIDEDFEQWFESVGGGVHTYRVDHAEGLIS